MENFLCASYVECRLSADRVCVARPVFTLTHYGNAGVCSRLHLGFLRCHTEWKFWPGPTTQLARSSYSCRSHNTRQRRPRPGPTHHG